MTNAVCVTPHSASFLIFTLGLGRPPPRALQGAQGLLPGELPQHRHARDDLGPAP
jgi:hypothetical protein